MNLHVFCIHISIMLLLQYALSKILPEVLEIDSESKVSDSSDDTESIHDTNHHSFKHSKSDILRGHSRRRRASEDKSSIKKQCAVMYKNDVPVGILQPYKDSYQFLPIHSDEQIPVEISPYTESQNSVKRDTSLNTVDDEDTSELRDEPLKQKEDNSQFSDERYPYIFAKFKVDSRVEKPYGSANIKQRTIHKRESDRSLVDEKRSDSLSSTLSRIKTNDERAEVELKGILNDMGLIDDETHVDKREAERNEDEDLEHGTNKINLIKLDDNDERGKREDLAEQHSKQSETATKHYEMIKIPEPKAINEEEYIDEYLNKNDDQSKEQDKKDIEKRSDDVAAEMERQIKSKLQKIKEEVRHEIDQIKSSNNEEFEEVDDDDDNDNEKAEKKENSQRRKRNVINTLVDEETSDINPVISADNKLVPHIRRRRKRGIIIEEDMSTNDKEDLMADLKKSEDEAQLCDLNSKNPIESKTVMGIDTTYTNITAGLSSEIASKQAPSSSVKRKRSTDEEPTLGTNEQLEKKKANNLNSKPSTDEEQKLRPNENNIKSKSNDAYDQRKGVANWRGEETNEEPEEKEANNQNLVLLKSDDMILDQLGELENMERRRSVEKIRSPNQTITGDSVVAPTEERLLMRNLKEYDDETSDEDVDKAKFEENYEKTDNSELDNEKPLNRDKKGCKCNNGDKDCKCGKASVKSLEGTDGSNFVYIDDASRLEDEKISSEKKNRGDKETPAIKIKLNPLTTDKKKSAKENIKYHKQVVNLHKSLRDGGYTLDIDPDIYRITDENPKSFDTRRKRDSFSDLVKIHGGGPIINHLLAVRERSMLPRIRVKKAVQTKDQTGQQLTLTDMSDEDLFGALPQSFEGELARFKRVKRTS